MENLGTLPDAETVHGYFMNLPDPIVYRLSYRMFETCFRLRYLRNHALPTFNRSYHHLVQIITITRESISQRRVSPLNCDRLHGILRRRCETIGRRIGRYNHVVRGSSESLYESSSNSSENEFERDDDLHRQHDELQQYVFNDSNSEADNVPEEREARLYHRLPASPTFSQATTHVTEDPDWDILNFDNNQSDESINVE